MTDIPDDVMKVALDLYYRLFTVDEPDSNPPDDVKHDIEIIARAIIEARDKALEDAAVVAGEGAQDDKNADVASEWYGGYASACLNLADKFRAMKSTEVSDEITEPISDKMVTEIEKKLHTLRVMGLAGFGAEFVNTITLDDIDALLAHTRQQDLEIERLKERRDVAWKDYCKYLRLYDAEKDKTKEKNAEIERMMAALVIISAETETDHIGDEWPTRGATIARATLKGSEA